MRYSRLAKLTKLGNFVHETEPLYCPAFLAPFSLPTTVTSTHLQRMISQLNLKFVPAVGTV